MRVFSSSIRRKLVTAMMATSTAVLLLTGATLIVYDIVSFRDLSVNSLAMRAEILAANSTAALAFQNSEDAKQVLAALRTDPSMLGAALYDQRGELFAVYPETAALAALPPAPSRRGHRFEQSSLVVFQPVVEQGRRFGTLYLKSDLRSLDARLRLYALVVLLAVGGSIGVAFALSTWLQRGIARPIRTLADAARSVSERKDYSIRAAVVSNDELGVLGGAFNDMLSEIQQRDVALRALNQDLERRVVARTAELEGSNRELEAFSYSVSHDLRAPLRHIGGFADLLRRHSLQVLDEAGRRYLTQISDSAGIMGQLIDDLLAFSRMGRREMQDMRVDLDALVREVRDAHASEVAGRDIRWTVSPLPEVQGDPAMLRVVVTNLIANAIKYTSTRSDAAIVIGAEQADGETTFYVRDNGVGFDMAYAHKLFGVFQRLHSAEEFEGIGIGLANVRRIIQRHGGSVRAEGELDRGATFYFTLPQLLPASEAVITREAA